MVGFAAPHPHNVAVHVYGALLVTDVRLEAQVGQSEHAQVTTRFMQRLQQTIPSLKQTKIQALAYNKLPLPETGQDTSIGIQQTTLPETGQDTSIDTQQTTPP